MDRGAHSDALLQLGQRPLPRGRSGALSELSIRCYAAVLPHHIIHLHCGQFRFILLRLLHFLHIAPAS